MIGKKRAQAVVLSLLVSVATPAIADDDGAHVVIGDEYLAGARQSSYSRADVDCDAANLLPDHLALAGMEARFTNEE